MVGKLSVSAFQNFFRIENPLSIKEVMSQNVWYVLFPSSTSSTYIALQPLCVFDLSSTSLTYFNIHLLWLVLISSTSSTYIAFQPLCVFDLSSTSSTYFNIHLFMACFYILDVFDIHSITALMCIWSIFDIFDIALIFCTVFNAFNAMYLNTSNVKQCALTHIGTCPLMYTQQIRWQWVRMSGFLTI